MPKCTYKAPRRAHGGLVGSIENEQKYRKRAAEMRARAHATYDRTTRTAFLEVADSWEALAKEVRDAKTPSVQVFSPR